MANINPSSSQKRILLRIIFALLCTAASVTSIIIDESTCQCIPKNACPVNSGKYVVQPQFHDDAYRCNKGEEKCCAHPSNRHPTRYTTTTTTTPRTTTTRRPGGGGYNQNGQYCPCVISNRCNRNAGEYTLQGRCYYQDEVQCCPRDNDNNNNNKNCECVPDNYCNTYGGDKIGQAPFGKSCRNRDVYCCKKGNNGNHGNNNGGCQCVADYSCNTYAGDTIRQAPFGQNCRHRDVYCCKWRNDGWGNNGNNGNWGRGGEKQEFGKPGCRTKRNNLQQTEGKASLDKTSTI